MAPINWFFTQFNRGFETLANFYGHATARLIRMVWIVLIVYAGLLFLTVNRLTEPAFGAVVDLIVRPRATEGVSDAP